MKMYNYKHITDNAEQKKLIIMQQKRENKQIFI